MPSQVLTQSGKLSEIARHLVLPSGIVSTGWPAVRDKAKSFGIVYDLWQDGLGRAMLAKRADGVYAAGIGGIIISICRQVGKTFTVGTIVIVLCVLFPGLKVLWTAHRTRTSDETFKSMQGIAKRKLLSPHIAEIRRANGQQEIEFVNGSRIMFGARETGFGRGFDDVDILVFDEGQILSQKALDDMVPSTNVSPNPLILFMGTPPKPSDPSEAFSAMRDTAISGASDDLMYLEISADPDASVDDKKQWAKANPSYPHRTREAAILRMKKLLGDESFLREGLGIWQETAVAGSVIGAQVWADTLDTHSTVPTDTPLVFGVAISPDRKWSTVGVAAYRADGLPHVEVVKHGEGVDWLLPYLVDLDERRKPESFIIDQTGPAATMLAAFTTARLKVRVTDYQAYKSACAGFVDAVRYSKVRHIDQAELTTAAIGVRERKVGDGWVYARRDSGVVIAPLEAVTLAMWGLADSRPVEPTVDFL